MKSTIVLLALTFAVFGLLLGFAQDASQRNPDINVTEEIGIEAEGGQLQGNPSNGTNSTSSEQRFPVENTSVAQ